ncbi:hypothetical protein D3OALGB2SA_1249 [Olavius algarvensis associated proteobacterium Delta 3]|nr:hypothetical protein D3OALGB2SA_1249 [Olavius algarvensis associated proteobacterium Delta 3]
MARQGRRKAKSDRNWKNVRLTVKFFKQIPPESPEGQRSIPFAVLRVLRHSKGQQRRE